VWGTGDALRDFLYVDDAMEIILEIAEKYDKGDPMNVGSGSPVTIKKLVETICRLTEFTGKVQVKPRFDPSKPEGQKNRTLDVSRMNKVVTYKPVTSLDAGIAKTIAWHRENK
jgi:GDP-L-fucose synthase